MEIPAVLGNKNTSFTSKKEFSDDFCAVKISNSEILFSAPL